MQAHSDTTRCELAVNEHEVVPPGESTHGWLPVEAVCGRAQFVVLQPAWKDTAAIGRGVVRPPVCPLAHRRLDEPLRFAVRARGVGRVWRWAMRRARQAARKLRARWPEPLSVRISRRCSPGTRRRARFAKGYMTSSKSVLSSSVR